MTFTNTFAEITSVENLLMAWKEFVKGKRKRADVQGFQLRLMENILSLHTDLRNRYYTHGTYTHFKVFEPKERDIHKATVRDRVLHRALYRILCPYFDAKFIYDSYSCRLGKGTHGALTRFDDIFVVSASFSHTKTCWVLKCDIRKFFANIDHAILLNILSLSIPDPDIIWLLGQIIGSFNSGIVCKGLPLGNLTSQLFVNIYMNEFDHFVKHQLKKKHYIRYADDFVLFSQDKTHLLSLIPHIRTFLSEKLHLELHPDKVFIKTLSSGIDFLGWVHFPNHRVLRTSTKRRMLAGVNAKNLSSYLGLLKQGNAYSLSNEIKNMIE